MNKKLILFDLDNTLFDPHVLKEKMFGKIAKLSEMDDPKGKDICYEMYNRHIKKYGFFDPKEFLEDLSQRPEFQDKKLIEKALFNEDDIKESIHHDAVEVLDSLSSSVDIGLLSQGEDNFQRAKIVTFQHYFHPDKIFILREKKTGMQEIFQKQRYDKIYYVDDMLEMLAAAKKIDSAITTIWIKRGRYALSKQTLEDFKPDAIIDSLVEILPIINN